MHRPSRTPDRPTVVFLHGVGTGPESWAAQIAALPGFEALAPRVPADPALPFTMAGGAGEVLDLLDRHGVDRAHLCGLSLGAMIATRIAIDHPDRCASLVLSGSQDRPNPALMALQNAIVALLPARAVAAPGMTKAATIALFREVARMDLRADLPRIQAPTLVLCGTRDVANLPAARRLAASIPGATLRTIRGAGHEANTQCPEAFTEALADFYATRATT